MWAIRSNRRFYSQGIKPRWVSTIELATHFPTEEGAHAEARRIDLEPTDYLLDPCYPTKPRRLNGGAPLSHRGNP